MPDRAVGTAERRASVSAKPVSGTALQFALLVTLGTLLLQAAWIVALPPFRGLDEIDHAYRASAVAHGQWIAHEPAVDGRGRLVAVPRSVADAAHDQCASLSYQGADNCNPVRRLPGGMVLIASSASDYNPLFYSVVGAVGLPFHGAGSLYAGRILAALLCALLIGAGAWCIGHLRSVWPRLGLLVALTPVGLYTTSIPAPNGLEIAAAVAVWCAGLALPSARTLRQERGMLVVLAMGTLLLTGLRLLGPGFFLVTAIFLLVVDGAERRSVLARHRLLTGTVVAAAALGVLNQVLWTTLKASEPLPQAVGNGAWQPQMLLLWPFQAVAAFPFRDQAAPPIVYATYFAVLMALFVTTLMHGSRTMRWAIGVLAIGILLMPAVLTAVTYGDRGAIWQGRYGLPLIVGAPLLMGVALREWRPRRPVLLLAIATAALFLCHVSGTVHVLHDEGARTVSVGDPAWHMPPAVLLIGLILAAWTLLGYAAARGEVTHE